MLDRIRLLFLLVAAQGLGLGQAEAMQFSSVEWRGHRVIHASGEIINGDAGRLDGALSKGIALRHGYPVVLLDSPGGSVQEAFNISKVLGRRKAHLVVPKGAKCQSACASIVFVAGALRTVEDGGFLGQHSCAVAGVKFEKCNELMSEHAFAHGVSYGSIQAFITYTNPDKMLLFSRQDADCWGITRYPFVTESGFDKSEPCFFRHMTKRWPEAQPYWRVDFQDDDFRAFRRTLVDHVSQGELSVYCNKSAAGGALTVEMRMPQDTANSIKSATIEAGIVNDAGLPVIVSRADDKLSDVSFVVKREHIAPLLKDAAVMTVTLERKTPEGPLSLSALLTTGRAALLFAASPCRT